jgi:penicillin-insensitive murein endopeptidase
VGSPTSGQLFNGERLEDSPALRVCPAFARGDVRWGVDSFVRALSRAARVVRSKHEGSVLNVGHLSRLGGGDVERHVSHESGRDADVGFYVRGPSGRSVLLDRFVAFGPDGKARDGSGHSFDDARNWLFVRTLLEDPTIRVTNIFVAKALRARLLVHASRVGEPSALRVRAANVLSEPRGVLPHDDHFHVRVGCAPYMQACVEYAQPRWSRRGGASNGRKRPATSSKPPSSKPPSNKPSATKQAPAAARTGDGKLGRVTVRPADGKPTASAPPQSDTPRDVKPPSEAGPARETKPITAPPAVVPPDVPDVHAPPMDDPEPEDDIP